jgi:hypothetical protein
MMKPDSGRVDPAELKRLFNAKADWHRRQAQLPLREKVRILLELQRAAYPLLKRQRTLQWWEKPWDVDP